MEAFGQENGGPDYSEIRSQEQVMELHRQGELVPLYLMPQAFGGEKIPQNTIYVPAFAAALKDRCDAMVIGLVREGRASRYSCVPAYKGDSFVAESLTISAGTGGPPMFTETIRIW